MGSVYVNPNISQDVWYNIGVIKSGTIASLYVNGSVVASGTISSSLFIGSDMARIGTGPSTGENGSQFIGSVCDIRIYNKALSQADINNLYNNGSGYPYKDLGYQYV